MRVMSARTYNRWFFTVNGVECSMPIDTAVYYGGAWNIIRAATIGLLLRGPKGPCNSSAKRGFLCWIQTSGRLHWLELRE